MMSIVCGDNYPAQACTIKFNSKVNLPCVNQNNGTVEPNKFHMFKNWNSSYTMEKVLIGLKNEMIANKKLPQPADGDMY
jgi:ubiquitin-conjugating enzyme E2 variant